MSTLPYLFTFFRLKLFSRKIYQLCTFLELCTILPYHLCTFPELCTFFIEKKVKRWGELTCSSRVISIHVFAFYTYESTKLSCPITRHQLKVPFTG